MLLQNADDFKKTVCHVKKCPTNHRKRKVAEVKPSYKCMQCKKT